MRQPAYGRGIIYKKAGEQAQAKAKGNYPAIDKIIKAVKTGVENGRDAGLDYEARAFGEPAMTPESYQLRQIFFATTEMKKETGADGVKPADIKRGRVRRRFDGRWYCLCDCGKPVSQRVSRILVLRVLLTHCITATSV